jgi:PAS domain S-box-containing protein
MHFEPCSLYRNLVENSPDVIWQTDSDLRFVYLNNAVATQFGYTPEELWGHRLPELLVSGIP